MRLRGTGQSPLKRMSDEEVEHAALDDPDAQPLTGEQLVRVANPLRKTGIIGLIDGQSASPCRQHRRAVDTEYSGKLAGVR